MSDILITVYPHLVAHPTPGGPVGRPGSRPHVGEASAGHGRDAAEICGSYAAVEVAVICRQEK